MDSITTGKAINQGIGTLLLSLFLLSQISTVFASTSIAPRTTSSSYDARGQFAVSTTNAISHSETHVFDNRYGVMTSMTGPNGLSTSWTYDSFGRKVGETRADTTTSTIVRQWCDGFNGQTGYTHCPSNGALAITTQTDGAEDSTAISDSLGRVIRVVAAGRDGTLIFSDTVYNARGEIDKKSQPYFEGDTPLWSELKYDALSRVYREISPDGSQNNSGFNGLSTTAINALGQINERTKNVLGNVTQVYDAAANDTYYRYDPFGNLVETQDADGNIISNTYDIRGRKIAMSDPDMGNWTYSYNALGELTSQTDAKSQTTTMVYDLLGRMTSRTELEGTSTWVYDTASNGIGKLHTETGPLGNNKTLSYDSLGRAYNVNTTIESNSFDVATSYDSLSRVSQVTYPQSTKYPLGLTVDYGYSETATDGAKGFLKTVTNNSDSIVYWQAKAQNAAGQLTDIMLGNGINTTMSYTPETNLVSNIQSGTTLGGFDIQNLGFEFDDIANLTKRSDYNQFVSLTALNEQFSYDSLNRMTSSTVLNQTAKSYGYDALGNITSKTGVGTYSYGNNAGPHAVTQTNLNGVFTSYAYDANGSMTSGKGRTINYTSFNKPKQITNATADITFTYGADRARIIRKNLITGKTRYYIGNLFEQETKAGLITYTHYIKAGGSTVAIETSKSDHVSSVHYLHKDHLGSITAITDSQGLIVEEQSYDPHGKRRNSDWTDIAGPSTPSVTTDRGFTGHEHIDEVGLVHMNGRVYDASLGRFISADPHIQHPLNAQSLNRYSYVLNNPLSFTDPSGFFVKKLIRAAKKLVKGIVKAVKNAVKSVARSAIGRLITSVVLCGPNAACHAGLAAAFTAANGGSIGDIIKSAAITYAQAQAFDFVGDNFPGPLENIIAHGVVGGTFAEIQGGSFTSGFISGGFGAFASNNLKLGFVGTTVAGGVGSVLGGGKFKNGAVTGAFGYLYNSLQHQQKISTSTKELEDALSVVRNTEDGARILDHIEGNAKIVDLTIQNSRGKGLGGTTIINLSPRRSLWDIIIGRRQPTQYAISINVNMNVSDPTFIGINGRTFTPSLARVVAHELGHAYLFSKGGYVRYSSDYHGAIKIENTISQQLDRSSPIRHPTEGHGRF